MSILVKKPVQYIKLKMVSDEFVKQIYLEDNIYKIGEK